MVPLAFNGDDRHPTTSGVLNAMPSLRQNWKDEKIIKVEAELFSDDKCAKLQKWCSKKCSSIAVDFRGITLI